MRTRATELLGIRYPIVQAGMSWASSSPELPAAVSNAGGLGVLAAGPMFAADFEKALRRLADMTDKPYAVNVPLYRPGVAEILDIIERVKPPVLIASQGGPKAHLQRFRDVGAKWLHVVSTLEHARKAAAAGVDGLVMVGAEAGGHPPANGVSTLVAVRRAVQELDTIVVAGGGVADGYGIAALLALGADAVQLGTRFLLTPEAAVHQNYKDAVLALDVDETCLVGVRSGLPVRMIRNAFADEVHVAEAAGLDAEAYDALLHRSSLRIAAMDGDVDQGKVETGQSAGLVDCIMPAAEVMAGLVCELQDAQARLSRIVGSEA